MVEPTAPGLQACTACYYTKRHEIKSSRRESDAIKRCSKQKMHEAAAGVTRPAVLQQISFFFFVSRESMI